MAFRTPPPWNPGYAVPAYVKAEGLESRAFVTQWAPRGTYDDPDPFDPSWDKRYATPEYIKAEGYGQGTFTTAWAPRGFYVGQVRSLEQKMKRTQKAMGDVVMPGLFATYGRRAAATMIAQVRQMPPVQRKETLRRVMNKIDPTLYDKTERYAKENMRRGADATSALEIGMARAMSEGFAKEIVDIGKKGRLPAAKGQLGLGCYGCAAVMGLGQAAKRAPTVTGAAPKPGQCSGNKIFKVDPNTGATYWATRSTKDVCTSEYLGPAPKVTVHEPGEKVSVPPTLETSYLELGPFRIPLNVAKFTIHWSSPLPAEWQKGISAELARETAMFGTDLVDASPGKVWNRFRDYIPNLPARVNQRFLGLSPRIVTGGQIADLPFLATTRPDTNEDWGLYLHLGVKDESKPWDSSTNPQILRIEWKKVTTSIFDWIFRVVSKIFDVAKDILDTVGGLACSLLSSSGAGLAAGAAAGAAGADPATGAAGVALAQQACGQPPPGGGAGGAAGEGWILPVAIAGAAVVAVALFLPKKKKAT